MVALLQGRQLQTATYAVAGEDQGTKVIFSQAGGGLSAVAQPEHESSAVTGDATAPKPKGGVWEGWPQGLDSPQGKGNPPVPTTCTNSATSTAAKKVPKGSVAGTQGGVVQEPVGEEEEKVESSESWVVVGGQEGARDVAAGSVEQGGGGAKDRSREAPGVRQVWGEGGTAQPGEQGGDREEKEGLAENEGDMEVEDIKEAVLLASEDAMAEPEDSPVAVLSLSKEITAEEPLVTPAEVERTPAKEELQGTPAKEELQVTPAKEELQVTPAKEELQVTPAKEELQVTPAKEELQGTPAKEELQGTPAKEELQVTPAKEELQGTPAKEEPLVTPAKELQVTPAKSEPQVTPVRSELQVAMAKEMTAEELLSKAAGATPAEEPQEMFSTPEGGQLLPQVRW